MVQFFFVLLSGVLAIPNFVSAKPLNQKLNYAIKETHSPPQRWALVEDAPKDSKLLLRIGLKSDRWDELERHLYEVSDPDHPRYGQHLSAEEVNELSKPNPEALKSVHNWLADHGFTEDKLTYNAAKDWIKLAISVEDAEALLDTKYSVFKHEDGTELIRTPQWSIPKDLHEHIVAIQPTNSFLRTAPKIFTPKPLREHDIQSNSRQVKTALEDTPTPTNTLLKSICIPGRINIKCLRTLYNTADYVPSVLNDPRNFIAFTNFINETSMDKDLQVYLKRHRPEATGTHIDITIINDGLDRQKVPPLPRPKQGEPEFIPNQLGNLNGQTLVGMVYPMKVKSYNTGGSPPFISDGPYPQYNLNEPYLEWLEYMLDKENNIPYTIGTSYGDSEQSVPKDYAIKTCQQMAMLGARGVSLLFASGDNGVGISNYCRSNDGKRTVKFMPFFPATCPYVTAVGATKSFGPEIAVWNFDNEFASGGGFSNYFAQPSYQASAVNGYLPSIDKELNGLYNVSGRAYPDLAAQGQGYTVYYNETFAFSVDGTTASTPTMAGIIALLNDYRLANNKTSLGFLNPWLYKEGYKGFTDITVGNARGCLEISNTLGMGFATAKGWDAVTGFGTPDFKKLQTLVLQKGGPENPLSSK